jgi:hypothetical protein
MEAVLSKNFSASELETIVISSDGLNSDFFADASYRAKLIQLMAMQAVQNAK